MKEKSFRSSIAVVGLGLMGSSIIVSFLKAGYRVVALTPLPEELEIGSKRIQEQLSLCWKMGLLPEALSFYGSRYQVTADYSLLKGCDLVIECVVEVELIKKQVYQHIERQVSVDTIIATNTSAIPISHLQQYLKLPTRFMGIHWAEPAYATRFLEITCGRETKVELAERIRDEAENWEKEPTLLYKDIRGFITNRLMYAVYREGFSLINKGHISMSGLDKCFQHDMGAWITIMGIFRRMDFIGLSDYLNIYKHLFPKLGNLQGVPMQMEKILEKGGRGIHNLTGLYPHTEASAEKLEQDFSNFNEEIYRLSDKYRKKINDLNL